MAAFQAQRAGETDTVGSKLIDRFCAMALELDAGGWLVNSHYSLAHLDLAPRNILVDPTSDTQLPIITGILDWDSAILAPMFMSCAPPLWIWGWQDDEDEDERTANNEPPTLEARQLKLLFEKAAGPDYMRLAYDPAYRLARRLVRFAFEGVRSNEHFKEAQTMLQEWAETHHPGKHLP
jgi:aminoglycoside phosphotransferase (APT) family kinase protein